MEIIGGMGGGIFRDNNNGHMDKNKGGWKQGREVGRVGVVGRGGGKAENCT